MYIKKINRRVRGEKNEVILFVIDWWYCNIVIYWMDWSIVEDFICIVKNIWG